MSEDRKITEEKIALLRQRSKNGFLNRIIKKGALAKETSEKPVSDEEYQEIIASIFD